MNGQDIRNREDIDFEFINDHLMILDTHLRLLLLATRDFQAAKKVLCTYSFDLDVSKDRQKIWDSLAKLSDACWRVAQIMKPDLKRLSKKEPEALKKCYDSFVKNRGLQICALLDLELSEKKSINAIRNAAVHVDERLDEWYVRLTHSGHRPQRITVRTLGHEGPSEDEYETANMFWYDYILGEIHHLGEKDAFSIRALGRGIEAVNRGLERADKFLQSHFQAHGRQSVFRDKISISGEKP